MRNNFSREDLDKIIIYLKQEDPILTNSINCNLFEEEWSEWLGTKFSVFVNSGSSANLLSMTILKIMHPEGGEVIVPPLTWVSDISSVIQCGFKPVFADINLSTLCMDTDKICEKINNNTKGVFITHAQGFNGLSDKLLDILKEKNIPLIEDVCESHGATHKGKKLGSFGLMSNFSFYYAHHMSTIEGGMICTDNEEIYENLRMLRSHGMTREIKNEYQKNMNIELYPDLNPNFIFKFPAYNLRNNEIGGILGRSQLTRLDENNFLRKRNFERFLNRINDKIFFNNFKLEGSSNYAFNLLLKSKDEIFMKKLMSNLELNGVEFRRGSAGGGNQLRQPYLKKFIEINEYKKHPNTEHVHFFGMYIGNFPDLSLDEVDEIVDIINLS